MVVLGRITVFIHSKVNINSPACIFASIEENLKASSQHVCLSNIFRHTGYIRTRQVLDREETGQFSFIVVARNEQPVQESFRSHQTINTENGPTFFDEVSVTVSVEDENDNAPALLRRGLLANDRVPVVQDIVPSVIDLTFRVSQNETSNPCIEFPYLLVDDDEGANGQTEVIVENNSYFEFRLDNTLLCIVKLEQPTVSQMNLFITVQDKPVDKTKTLKRQYTIRVHFVEDKAPSDNLRQFEPFHASRFIANPTVLSSSETAENKPVRMENLKSGRKSKISNSRKTHYDVENNELLNQKPLASGATLMIVAILVAVSGLLCLLLLGVVLALRKATINGINATSSEYRKFSVDLQCASVKTSFFNIILCCIAPNNEFSKNSFP